MAEERGRSAVTDDGSDRRGRSISAHRNKNNEYVTSSGRGGAGNIVRSRSPPHIPDTQMEDAKLAHEHRHIQVREGSAVAVGRGGAGNMRSPSRDPKERQHMAEASRQMRSEERSVERSHAKQEAEHPHPVATGRGGAGNIHSSAEPNHSSAASHHSGSTEPSLLEKILHPKEARAASRSRDASGSRDASRTRNGS